VEGVGTEAPAITNQDGGMQSDSPYNLQRMGVRTLMFQEMVRREIEGARGKHAPIHSLHEGYAVILEELDEVKQEIWKRAEHRSPTLTLKELVQVAAMAQRVAEDCGLLGGTKPCSPPS
jgi:hypothetical protein